MDLTRTLGQREGKTLGWLHACYALSVTKQVRMARVLRPGEHDDGSFDRAFWREVGHEGIFEAAWELVNEYRTFRGLDGDEPRLQRSVCRVIRPGG